jgi:hypothetical protein
MPRRIRDVAVTVAVLLVLLMMLVAIDSRVRDRVDQLSGDVGRLDWSASGGSFISAVAATIYDVVADYASDNTYLFSFLVGAVVLFVLMLRT